MPQRPRVTRPPCPPIPFKSDIPHSSATPAPSSRAPRAHYNMASIFPGRRKHQRPVPTANDRGEDSRGHSRRSHPLTSCPRQRSDPWGMRDTPSSAEDAPSTSNTRAAAAKLMHSMRKFSYSTPRKRERDHSVRGPLLCLLRMLILLYDPQDGLPYSTPAESSPPTPSADSGFRAGLKRLHGSSRMQPAWRPPVPSRYWPK